MKEDVVEYKIDSFVDFNGVERKIIACALSQSPEISDGYNLCVGWTTPHGDTDVDDRDFALIHRVVTIGIAICNPTDKYDEEVGKKTALNKAKYDPNCPTLYTISKGVASKALVDTFLTQEIKFTKENPERIIKGYNQKKERFDKKERIKQAFKDLSETERYVVNLIQEGVNVSKCVELVEKAKTAGISLNE